MAFCLLTMHWLLLRSFSDVGAARVFALGATVARGLGLRLPDERELTERMTAVR